MESVDCVYYINLDHRTDRREQIEAELVKFGVPPSKRHRISAIFKPKQGALGCGLSHIHTLERFLQSSHTTCIILEDDFQLTVDPTFAQFLLRQIAEKQQPPDLVMLAGKVFESKPTDSPFFFKVQDAQTTSAYWIHRKFAPALLQTMKEAMQGLAEAFAKEQKPKYEVCLDIYWKRLQPSSDWLITHPKLGLQRESYSDIESRVTNYGV